MKLLMFLLLITLPAVAPAQFTFTTNNGTITITGYTGKGGSVVIPAKINGWPVTAIGSIGQPGAFEFCSNLTKVTIPTNVLSIGSQAFFGCPKLTNVLIADGVTSIDPLAFTLCTRLKAITVSPNNRFYSTLDGVLFNRNKTTLVQYPGGLRASYVIPSTVKSISEFAFESALVKNITIPDSVTNIGFQAFCAATNLVKVTIPKSVVEMGIGVFWYCSSLKTITVAAKNPAFSSLDGVLFDKCQTTLIQYPGGRADGYIMPASVTNIGYLAFAQCSGLKGVTIDDGVTTIQSGAFSRCTSLANIVIPNNVTSLGASTFYHCTSLTNISIGNSVANIEVLTFCGCSNLLDVTIPASVTNIAASAFADCTSLTSVYFEGNAPEVEPTAFIGDDNASAYYLPGATGWSFPFAGLPGIAWIQFTYVTNNGGITITGYTGTNSNVIIPDTINGLPVSSIGDLAFQFCSGLTNIMIPDSVTNIGDSAFYSCNSLQSLAIPNSVMAIGDSAFWGCSSLANITLPTGITTIGNLTFGFCGSLTSVTIPKGVASLGDYAFFGCGNLAGCYFQGNAPALDSTVFGLDSKTIAYYLPGATGWSGFASSSGIPTDLQFLPSPWIVADGLGFGVQSNNFSFAVAWATNVPVVIEACTNLSAPVWQPVQTNTPIGGSFTFSDPQWTNFSARYYRLSSP